MIGFANLTDEEQDELDANVRDAAVNEGERAISEDDGPRQGRPSERVAFLVNACGWTEEEVAGALGRDPGGPPRRSRGKSGQVPRGAPEHAVECRPMKTTTIDLSRLRNDDHPRAVGSLRHLPLDLSRLLRSDWGRALKGSIDFHLSPRPAGEPLPFAWYIRRMT